MHKLLACLVYAAGIFTPPFLTFVLELGIIPAVVLGVIFGGAGGWFGTSILMEKYNAD